MRKATRQHVRQLRTAVAEALEPRRLLANSVWAYPGADGRMLYQPRVLGDHVEDFSAVGYRGGTVGIPDVPVKATVSPVAGDDTATIQAAINAVQGMALDASGFRGAVLLMPGTYEIGTSLKINASGVVLRGSGQDQTILHATGTGQRTIISVDGSGTRSAVSGTTHTITDKYVPVGAFSFTVDSTANLAVGDQVIVHRPSTQQWINDMGMNLLDNPWTPGSKDINMDRTITHIDGNVITVDAPVAQALEKKYTDASQGNNTIYKYTANGRLQNVGVEFLSGYSDYDPTLKSGSDFIDEDHPWVFIQVDGSINAWVRNITAEYFGYSGVYVTGNSKYVTVQDSQNIDPVSQVTGGRRYSFNIDDSSHVLFRNLYTRGGRHDFVEGSTVTGPNVFVDSRADKTRADAGPHHRYSTLTLWDNVTAGQINIQDRGNSGTGHGHAGANQVIWNSTAGSFIVQSPIAAQNWLIGSIGTVSAGGGVGYHTAGLIDSQGTNVTPRSLYYQQLGERTGYDGFVLRETRVGDADSFVNDGAVDNVAVDAAWLSSIQSATGKTRVGFDTVGGSQLVPMTFNLGLDAGTYVVGASLSLGLKTNGSSSAGDRIYVENAGRYYSWAELGVATPTATAAGVVIDLSKLLAVLQDGKLNIAILGNTAVDWATLNFQTASTAQPTTTVLNPSDDAYVQDGTSASTNFGSATTIQTKKDSTNNNRESYLKFDLTGLTSANVASAILKIYPTTVGLGDANAWGSGIAAIFNQVSFVPTDAWGEGTITWNNRPAADPYFREFMSYPNEPVTVDVTSLVRGALAGDKLMSLRLASVVQSTSGQISFASGENANPSLRPQLVIQSFDGVTPVADAYVWDGQATTNFGSATDLETKNSTSGFNREAYLKFDLSSLGTSIAAAQVRLMPFAPDTANVTNYLAIASSNAWTETGITWNNKPASGPVLQTWRPLYMVPVVAGVTAAANASLGADKLLSVRVGSSTSSSGITSYGSRESADLGLRPLLTVTNLRPMVTPIKDVSGTMNTAIAGVWFGAWDAETSAFTLSATSSNPTLLPVNNITFGGSGADRTLSLNPASGQGGFSDVTVTVTDAQGLTSTTTFRYTVTGTAGGLVIDGDQDTPSQNDVFRIVRSGAFLDVFRNDLVTPVAHADYASTTSLAINGLGGDDVITLDYTAGNPVPTGGITIDGGAGTDTLSIIGAAGAEAVTLTAGAVNIAGVAAGYTAIETLDLTLGAGGDTLSVSGNAAVSAAAFTLNVSAGTLSMAPSAVLPTFSHVAIAAGATFNLAGTSQAIDQLTGSGTLSTSAGGTTATLTVGQNNGSSTFAGTLANGSGTLALTKVGAGKLTLTGANSYTGLSTLAGGVLEAGSSAAFVGLAGQVRFNGGTLHVTGDSTAANVANKFTTSFAGASTSTSTGTFDIDAGVTLTIGGSSASLQTNGGGSHGSRFTKTGPGTLRILSNNGQQDDPFQLSQGTVIAESATALGGGDSGVRIDMKSGTTLILRQDVPTNFLTPINSADAGGTISVILDRLTTGPGVTHSVNAITSAGAFALNLSAGSHVSGGTAGLSVGSVTMSGSGTFTVGAGAVMTVTGTLSGAAASLTKTGLGGLTAAGTIAYTGSTVVTDGTFLVQSDLTASPAITVTGGTLRLAAGAGCAVRTGSLTMVGSGRIDLADGSMLVDYSGTTPIATLRGYLFNGRAGGTWSGPGLVSGVAAVTPNGAIGYAEAADLGLASFAGQSVDTTAVLFRYAPAGDANLDGQINSDDYALADRGRLKSLGVWVAGDFDYDGAVTDADYTLLNQTARSLMPPAPATVSVSEPVVAATNSATPAPTPASSTPTRVTANIPKRKPKPAAHAKVKHPVAHAPTLLNRFVSLLSWLRRR